MPAAVTVGQAAHTAARRGDASRRADAGALNAAIADLRAQLYAADQRIIACAAELRAERREREAWQRIAAERAERIVALEQGRP